MNRKVWCLKVTQPHRRKRRHQFSNCNLTDFAYYNKYILIDIQSIEQLSQHRFTLIPNLYIDIVYKRRIFDTFITIAQIEYEICAFR